ncbi:lectin [Gyrodon lividus]|nr:lectin [Gyrodon lividus]
MAYVINLQVFQGNPARGFFNIVEKTVWNFGNGGTWAEAGGVHTLTMGSSGTSGTLRFQSATTGEFFLVAVGVNNDNPWCNIVPNLVANQTGVVINGEYYNEGARAADREAQLLAQDVVSTLGTNVGVEFVLPPGAPLQATITIA